MGNEKPEQMSAAALAYVGDAVLELMVREHAVALGYTDAKHLNQIAGHFVRASAQSEAMERILPMLTETEEAIFRRGRNLHGVSAPKSASIVEYRRATGMEALFAYLHLSGQTERKQTLFAAAFDFTPFAVRKNV